MRIWKGLKPPAEWGRQGKDRGGGFFHTLRELSSQSTASPVRIRFLLVGVKPDLTTRGQKKATLKVST